MARFLSAQWMDRHRELSQGSPRTPGASARVQQIVTGGPDGDVAYATVIEDGRVVEQALGRDPGPDLTVTGGYDDAVRIARGELDAAAAFMQGRLKVAGPMSTFMGLMPLTGGPGCRTVHEALAAETDF